MTPPPIQMMTATAKWRSVLSDKDIQFAIFAKVFILFTCENVVEFFATRPEVNNPLTSLRNCKNKNNNGLYM